MRWPLDKWVLQLLARAQNASGRLQAHSFPLSSDLTLGLKRGVATTTNSIPGNPVSLKPTHVQRTIVSSIGLVKEAQSFRELYLAVINMHSVPSVLIASTLTAAAKLSSSLPTTTSHISSSALPAPASASSAADQAGTLPMKCRSSSEESRPAAEQKNDQEYLLKLVLLAQGEMSALLHTYTGPQLLSCTLALCKLQPLISSNIASVETISTMPSSHPQTPASSPPSPSSAASPLLSSSPPSHSLSDNKSTTPPAAASSQTFRTSSLSPSLSSPSPSPSSAQRPSPTSAPSAQSSSTALSQPASGKGRVRKAGPLSGMRKGREGERELLSKLPLQGVGSDGISVSIGQRWMKSAMSDLLSNPMREAVWQQALLRRCVALLLDHDGWNVKEGWVRVSASRDSNTSLPQPGGGANTGGANASHPRPLPDAQAVASLCIALAAVKYREAGHWSQLQKLAQEVEGSLPRDVAKQMTAVCASGN